MWASYHQFAAFRDAKMTELARKRIYLVDDKGQRQSVVLRIALPKEKTKEGVAEWECEWGLSGILDSPRSLVGDTAFDALLANVGAMKRVLKDAAKGRVIIDADIEEFNQKHPQLGESAEVSLKSLFGDI